MAKHRRVAQGVDAPWPEFLIDIIASFVHNRDISKLRRTCRAFRDAYDAEVIESWTCPSLFGLPKHSRPLQVIVRAIHHDAQRRGRFRSFERLQDHDNEKNFMLDTVRELQLDSDTQPIWHVADLPAFSRLRSVWFHSHHPSLFLPYGSTLPQLTELYCRVGFKSYFDHVDFTCLTRLQRLYLWNRDQVAALITIAIPLTVTTLGVDVTCRVESGQTNVQHLKLKRIDASEFANFSLTSSEWPALRRVDSFDLVSCLLVLPEGPLSIEELKLFGSRPDANDKICVVSRICQVSKLRTLELSEQPELTKGLFASKTLAYLTGIRRLQFSVKTAVDLRPLLALRRTLTELVIAIEGGAEPVDTKTIGHLSSLERLELDSTNEKKRVTLDARELAGCVRLRHLKLLEFQVKRWPHLCNLDSLEVTCGTDPTRAFALLPKSIRRITFGSWVKSEEHLAKFTANLARFSQLEWLDLSEMNRFFKQTKFWTHNAFAELRAQTHCVLPLCVIKL